MIATVAALLPAFVVIAASSWAGRRMLTPDSIKGLSGLTFSLLMPALLFRSTLNFHFDPQYAKALVGYFVPTLGLWIGVMVFYKYYAGQTVAFAAARGLATSFSNTVQLGIPLTVLAFGERGLGILLALIALHALVIITIASIAVEFSIARQNDQGHWRSLWQTVKAAVLHPVILPILAGLAGSYSGLKIPQWLDLALKYLADGAGPMCLVLLGAQLAHIPFGKTLRSAARISIVKLLVHPALVFAALWLTGIGGFPLAVLTCVAALPIGSNAFLFAQRYETDVDTITTAVGLSTLLSLITYTVIAALVRTL